MSNDSWLVEYGGPEWDDLKFAAEMEARQLHALEIRIDKEHLIEELPEVDQRTSKCPFRTDRGS